MIIDLYMETSKNLWKIDYTFKNNSTNEIIAIANNEKDKYINLTYLDKKYYFKNYPKKMERYNLPIKYPLCSKRKWTIGFYITDEKELPVCSFYSEAVTYGKWFIFKKNLGLTVFRYNDKTYSLYRVGFKEPCHYYCLYDDNDKTIAIIQRLYGSEKRAIIYVEKEKNIFLSLLVCTSEIINVANLDGDGIDTSAENYISISEIEKERFDKNFINKFKMNGGNINEK